MAFKFSYLGLQNDIKNGVLDADDEVPEESISSIPRLRPGHTETAGQMHGL